MRYWVARIIAAGWLLVLVLSSTASATTEMIQPAYVFGDFVLHAFGYFGLTVLLVFSQRQLRIWITAIIAMLIGIAMEGVQAMTPNRAMEPSGALANAVGALVGAGFFWFRCCLRTS